MDDSMLMKSLESQCNLCENAKDLAFIHISLLFLDSLLQGLFCLLSVNDQFRSRCSPVLNIEEAVAKGKQELIFYVGMIR